MSLSCVPLPF
uniref:Protein DEK isoform X4 n=1 Tax=Rhizophora mucronata TaxID=61149 RepID=A0A2P2JCY2_RHIMU